MESSQNVNGPGYRWLPHILGNVLNFGWTFDLQQVGWGYQMSFDQRVRFKGRIH